MASGTGNSGKGNGSGDGPGQSASGRPASQPVDLVRQDSIRVGPLKIDPPARRIAHDDGREEILEPRMMQVLVALIRAKGTVLSRDDLIDSCWDGRIVGDEAISSVIYRLRRALREIADGIVRVETIAKVGFRLVSGPSQTTVLDGEATRRRARPPLHRAAHWARMAAAVAGVVALSLVAGPTVPGERSFAASVAAGPALAVLPFADLSPGLDNAYFAEGMAEEIMGLVSDEPGLRVIGRTSIEMLGEGAGINEARTRLGVTHVLEGSVRRSGQALRVNVRLIDARDGSQVWAKEFDRSLGDVFAIQDDIGAQVLSQLRVTLAKSGRPTTFRTRPEVYDLYLAALALERDETRTSMLRASKLLERAIQLDPTYAPAYARLASYSRELWSPDSTPEGREWETSLAHARRALDLGPNLGDAHAAMAMLVETEQDWARAIPYVQRAVELDPGNFLAWELLGHVQERHLCRDRDAASSYRRASAIEPLMAGPRMNLTHILAEMGEFEAAKASARQFNAVSRDRTHLPKFWGAIAYYSGDLSSAARWQQDAVKADPGNWRSQFGHMQILRALQQGDRAIEATPEFARPMAVPLLRGDSRAAASAAIRIGDEIWAVRPGHLSLAMPALLSAGQEEWLVQSFDRNYPSVEALDEQFGCKHSIMFAPHLVVALRRQGRDRDAERLLRLTKRRFKQWSEAGHRGPMREVLAARLFALDGRHDAALSALEKALKLGWLDQFWPSFGLGDSVFDPLRNDRRFRAVERRARDGARRESAEQKGRQPLNR